MNYFSLPLTSLKLASVLAVYQGQNPSDLIVLSYARSVAAYV